MRFARGDLRTHIDSDKDDHRPYWLQSTLPLQHPRRQQNVPVRSVLMSSSTWSMTR